MSVYIPHKTLLTEATEVNWLLRELVKDPTSKAKAKKAELFFEQFMNYRNDIIKKTSAHK